MSTRRAGLRSSAVAGALTLTVVACRGILGIEELPPEVDTSGTEPDDARGDASSSGRPRPREAGVDGAPTGSFCQGKAPVPAFCSDFEVGDVRAGWVNEGTDPDQGLAGGGMTEADSVAFRSGPRSVRFSLPPLVSTSDRAAAYVMRTFDEMPRYVRAEFSMRVDTESFASGDAFVSLFSIDLDRGRIGGIELYRTSEGAFLRVKKRRPDGKLALHGQARLNQFVVGQWQDFVLLIRNYPLGMGEGEAASEGRVTILTGGPQAELSLPVSFQAVPAEPSWWLTLGVIGQGPMTAFRVNFDNVAAELREPR